MGTSARQASIRVPNPEPSTAMDHLGTTKVVQSKILKKVSESCWHAAGSWPGVSGMMAGAGASDVTLKA